jgi:hypothetical protein
MNGKIRHNSTVWALKITNHTSYRINTRELASGRTNGTQKIFFIKNQLVTIPVPGTISSPFFKTRHHGGFLGLMF